jgi:hypothetical protein
MRRLLLASLFASSSMLVAACGDDGGSKLVDARPVGMDAAVECAAAEAYGDPTLTEMFAGRDADTNPETAYVGGSLNMDYDDLVIELYKGFGVFTDTEIVPTTVQLTGDEGSYDDCGACVLIYANYSVDTEEYEMLYIAIGGTLNITQVTPNIQGNLINASFVHVTIDSEGVSTPSPDNCASTIEGASFDTPVMTDEPAFAPVRRPVGHKHRRR